MTRFLYEMDDDDTSIPSTPYCLVYSKSDPFTVYVQFFLAFMALSSLWLKRQREVPRRDLKTWALDVTKMGGGAVYGHIANMGVAKLVSGNVREGAVLEDECAWCKCSRCLGPLSAVRCLLFARAALSVASHC
jgi:hypothetical protein